MEKSSILYIAKSMEAWRHGSMALLIIVLTSFNGEVVAQTFGLTSTGSVSYPTTNVGHTNNGTNGSNSGNYLMADKYTITVPLTAIQIRTYGTSSGNVKVSIYDHDATNNRPNNRLITEISSAVTANTWSTISIPNGPYLQPGTYWIVANHDGDQRIRSQLAVGTTNQRIRSNSSFSYTNSFPANGSSVTWFYPGAGNERLDDMYMVCVAVQGYAKATKATLGANGNVSSVSFYTHAAGNARLAIYSDASGAPSAKQWESGDLTITATGQPKWTTVNINAGTPSELELNPGTYWLAWQWNNATSGPSYIVGAANSGNYLVQAYGAFPANWTGGTFTTENWSIYATYCAMPTATVAGQSNVSCYAGNNGSITITANGGAGQPYMFSIDNGSSYQVGTNPYTFSGLTAGTYYPRVKDVNGCKSPSCP